MNRQLRACLLLSVAASLGCATPTAPATGDRHDGGGRGEARPSTPPASATGPARVEAVSIRSQTLAAPVAVVSIAAAEAGPCEQMCGRVGDCLDDRKPGEASQIELGCLELCVSVRPETPAAKSFHGCRQRGACDELVDCVSDNWSAAAGARVEYDTLVDAIAADTCELYCRGVYSCMYYNKTLAQAAEFSADTEREIDSCVQVCNPNDNTALSLAGCAMEPTCDEYWRCYEESQMGR